MSKATYSRMLAKTAERHATSHASFIPYYTPWIPHLYLPTWIPHHANFLVYFFFLISFSFLHFHFSSYSYVHERSETGSYEFPLYVFSFFLGKYENFKDCFSGQPFFYAATNKTPQNMSQKKSPSNQNPSQSNCHDRPPTSKHYCHQSFF